MAELNPWNSVPSRFVATCEYCEGRLDVREPGTYQYTCGWVMQRSGGGGHGVSLPERSNRWAHRLCIETKIRGDQTTLL